MKDSEEFTILKEGNVKITNRRAIIGTKIYSMSTIDAASVSMREPKLFVPVFFMLITAVCLALVALTNLDDLSHILEIGLYIGVGGLIFFLLSTKTKYSVQVRSSVGELNIFEANDKASVERIVRAMNEAIFLREEQ
ncbi:MAG: DUF6232 family protein [Anaerolineales bacterium]